MKTRILGVIFLTLASYQASSAQSQTTDNSFSGTAVTTNFAIAFSSYGHLSLVGADVCEQCNASSAPVIKWNHCEIYMKNPVQTNYIFEPRPLKVDHVETIRQHASAQSVAGQYLLWQTTIVRIVLNDPEVGSMRCFDYSRVWHSSEELEAGSNVLNQDEIMKVLENGHVSILRN